MAALNYSRMPGPGDLPGDRSHPNSPDYVEPAFGMDDAAGNVARHLWDEDEVGGIVDDLAEAAPALRALAVYATENLPPYLRCTFTLLLGHADRTERMRQAEYDLLNGRAA